MAIYQFSDFTFCDQSYQLTRSGEVLNIRPKTAQALNLFIHTPQTLITKDTLHKALWGKQYNQDYRLFQVISEIRKLAPDENLIRTQPNQGYYWQVPVNKRPIEMPKHLKKYAIAASFSVVSLLTTVLVFKDDNGATPSILPTQNSYTLAVNALQSQDFETAQKWLYFNLQENPHSQEAKLLLAEIKFSQQQVAHAKQLAYELLTENESQNYYQGQALSLLSRIASAENNFNDALDFALKGQQSAEQGLALCSAEIFKQHITALIDEQQVTQKEQIDDEQVVSGKLENAQENSEHAQLCKQLKESITSKLTCDKKQYIAMLKHYKHVI